MHNAANMFSPIPRDFRAMSKHGGSWWQSVTVSDCWGQSCIALDSRGLSGTVGDCQGLSGAVTDNRWQSGTVGDCPRQSGQSEAVGGSQR